MEQVVEELAKSIQDGFSITVSDVAFQFDQINTHYPYVWDQTTNLSPQHTSTTRRPTRLPPIIREQLKLHIPVSPEDMVRYFFFGDVIVEVGKYEFICDVKYYICRYPEHSKTGLLFLDK